MVDVANNAEWYIRKLKLDEATSNALLKFSANTFHGYKIGTELLIINASLTFFLLFLCSKKGGNVATAMPD